MCLHTASIESTNGNKTRLFPSPFQVSASSRLTLAGLFRSDHLATCGAALRSATEENESVGCITVPCPSKVTKHRSSSVVTSPDWYDGTHTEQIFTFKVTL